MPGKGYLHDQLPIKILGTESLISFLAWQLFHMYCLKSLLGELSSSCVIPLGEDSWKLVSGFPWSLPHVPFLCANFVLYPFAVINQSHEYYYMSNTVSFAKESPNLTGNLSVLGTLLNQPSHTGQT